MSRRARLGFLAACLLVFALVAAVITWGPPQPGRRARRRRPSPWPRRRPSRPASAVTDLHDLGSCKRGSTPTRMPRLVLRRWPLPEGSSAGARWAAQNILRRYQDARLRVYVVWVKRWALDTRRSTGRAWSTPGERICGIPATSSARDSWTGSG